MKTENRSEARINELEAECAAYSAIFASIAFKFGPHVLDRAVELLVAASSHPDACSNCTRTSTEAIRVVDQIRDAALGKAKPLNS